MTASPWIKICGLTDVDNALDVAALGPDAIGLVFFEKSPRNVSIGQAGTICAALPDSIMPVGVFVDEPYEKVLGIAQTCALKGVQLHGGESPDMVARLLDQGLTVIKGLFATRPPYLSQAPEYSHASYLLIEYGKGTLPGGNAESWDYEISRQLDTDVPVILAGGLDADNVREAIQKARPAGVDISSNVEARPGFKDIKKVKYFIRLTRSTHYI